MINLKARILIFVDPEIAQKLTDEAKRQGLSRTAFIENILKSACRDIEFGTSDSSSSLDISTILDQI